MKTFTVITSVVKDGTKGLIARERYISSTKNVPSHENRTQIVPILGTPDTYKRIVLAGESYALKQQIERKRGRRLTTFAMEFVMTIPPVLSSDLSNSEWREITKDCCISLARHLKLNNEQKKEFFRNTRAVLHQQSNSHVHMICPKVVGNTVLKDIQKKPATALLKSCFTHAVYKHANIAIKSYTPQERNRGMRLKNWQYQKEKFERAEIASKLVQKIQRQAEKWFSAFEEDDIKQMNRQFNRLNGSLSESCKVDLVTSDATNVHKVRNRIEKLSGKRFFSNN